VSATIGPEGGIGVRVGTGEDGEPGLDIDFVVSMNDDPEPDQLHLRIWNPSASTVAAAQAAGAVVTLSVGHLGDDGDGVVRRVFVGNPVRGGVRFDRSSGSGDRLLEIEARDGGSRYSLGRLSVSFATATTAQQVFDAISADLGLPLGTVDLDGDLDFPHGVVLVGAARKVLDDLVGGMGRAWSVRDGALYVLPVGADTGEEAVVFSTADGNLLGAPVPTDEGIEVRGLLAPTLRPRKIFKVESPDVNGFYRCTDLQFVGSSYAGRFDVVAKGVPKG